jgi:hypothetical protein
MRIGNRPCPSRLPGLFDKQPSGSGYSRPEEGCARDTAVVDLAAGQQVDFAINPTSSRKYTIEVKGSSDALLVLFEDINGVPRFLSGDDDSGQERSASITYKLFEGRSYIARVRLFHPGPTGKTSLMYS